MAPRTPPHVPAVLAYGAVAQIGQVLLLRELLMAFHGSELSIGLILAAWLAWVGVGSWLGTLLAHRARRPWFLLALLAAGLLLVLPATVLLVRGLRGFFRVLPGAHLSLPDMTIACLLVPAPVCLLLGAQFVLLARVWRESDRAEDTSGARQAYAGEAVGTMLGGILFTFLMVRHLNALQSALLAGMLMLSVYVVTPLSPKMAGVDSLRRHRPALWGLLLLAILAFPFAEHVNTWAYRLQWRYLAPHHQFVEVRQSKHGTIAVMRREDQYSLFQSGHLVLTTAGPHASAPGLEEQEAAALAHVALVQHQRPERILLIGGGLRGTLREVARHPVHRIDYIELDEVLTRAARPYVPSSTLQALADPRIRLIHTDGRLYVRTAREEYDLIIVDLPDPATAVLNRFYTKEFFHEARTILAPDGVLVIGVTSTPELRGLAVANRNAMVYHTLRTAFSHVLVVGEQHLLYVATNAPEQASVDVPTLQQRYRERGIASESFSELHYPMLLYETQLRRVNWVVRAHGRRGTAHLEGPEPPPLTIAPVSEQLRAEELLPPVAQRHFVNSDLRPIGYSYTLMLWDARTGAHGSALQWLLRVEPWWVLPLVGVPLLAAAGLRGLAHGSRDQPHLRFALLFAVFSTGLAMMSLQVALLFSFQTLYGFVYEMVGLIVALFMAGLAAGTLLTHRHAANAADLRTLTHLQLLVALLAGLIALALPGAAALPSPAAVLVVFSTLTLVAGLANGASFSVSSACATRLRLGAEQAAGAVYGVELLGACLGAVVASVVVAPMLGIVGCCTLAATANATAFGVLLIARRFDAG